MTDQSGPYPQRIGDAERDRATELLRDHLAEGRLDQLEFDERLTRALTARTQADLDPLFTDLPGPRPGGSSVAPAFQAPPWQQQRSQTMQPAPTPAPVPARGTYPWGISSGAAWFIVILAASMLGWNHWWWLVFIPIFLSGGWGHQRRDGRRRS